MSKKDWLIELYTMSDADILKLKSLKNGRILSCLEAEELKIEMIARSPEAVAHLDKIARWPMKGRGQKPVKVPPTTGRKNVSLFDILFNRYGL